MSQNREPEHISKKELVYRIAGMEDVRVRRDVEYRAADGGALTLDIYYPPDSQSGTRNSKPEARIPAIVFVAGFPDVGFEAKVGCKFKEMGASVSWARATAASGLIAVTYTNREPARNIHALLQYVRGNAAALGVDENRIGLWASSGNVPLALSLLMQEASVYVKCAVLCYGYMLDLDGSTHIADAARTWGFVNPCAGKSVAELPKDVPLFIARAGQDGMPHLNETLGRFLSEALRHNLPVTFANHAAAPHAFDLLHDSATSREIIRQILQFMRFHLLNAPAVS